MGKAAKPSARKSRAKAAEAALEEGEPTKQEPSSSAADAGASGAEDPPQGPSSTRKTRGTRAPAEDETLQQQPPRQRRRKGEPPANAGAADMLHPPNQAHPMARQPPLSIADMDVLMEAVIKVFCIHTEPNFSLPWQRKRQYSSSSSGFMMQGRRILTNAHCVDHHTQVKVKRRGSDKKYVASVLAVGTECDIAMLTVEDEEFWAGVEPVRFGDLPKLQDAVTVVGYPIGGDTMSVTSGVVSRIEVTSYVHGAAELLGIQIDAAINSGNSGGPAFNTAGQCVGIAFQSLKHEDAENIAYIIPTPVIQHFINDCDRNGDYTGFPGLGVEWQKLENPDLRRSLKMETDQKGVMIRRIEPTAPVHKVLSQYDVLLSFDGVDIASDGTVPFRSGERISFSYLVSSKYTNEEAELRVLHDGKVKTVKVRLQAPVRLVPFHIKNKPPSYFIVAGLVFTPITVPYLRSEYGKEFDFDAPVKLLNKMMHGMAETADQQVVVLSQVLASDVNIGYEDILNTQVQSLNGVKVHNMAGLVKAVEAALDGGEEFLQLELDYNQMLVLSTAHAREATPAILEMHCIASDRSSDLQTPAAQAAAAAAAAKAAPVANGVAQDAAADAAGASRAGGRSSGRQR